MNQDFLELVEYLDKKFDQTATKDDVRGLQIGVANLQEDVRVVKTELTDLKETVHELVTAIDKLAKVVDDLCIEYAAVVMKVDRHEKWIQQLAAKLGMKLGY